LKSLWFVIVLLCAVRFASAAPPATQPLPTPRADTAVDLALLHLERRQHAEGHFQSEPKLALTGLALTAYLARGNAPDFGRHGATVRRATDFLLRSAPEDGYFGKADGSRMYGQAIVTIALTQAYGLEQDASRRVAMRAVLVKAAKVILDAQNVKKDAVNVGGWRYEPTSIDSDLSATAWNAIALRAARDIGLDVPDAAFASAAAYVKRCIHASGGFAHQPGGEASISTTAAALVTLSMLGSNDVPEIAAAAKFLREHPIVDTTGFPYYATYNVNQAADRVGGETWNGVYSASLQRLLRTQLPSGAWPPQSSSAEEPGEVYATAMAVLALSVPDHVLPLFQH
jgi:hypothetical protein